MRSESLQLKLHKVCSSEGGRMLGVKEQMEE